MTRRLGRTDPTTLRNRGARAYQTLQAYTRIAVAESFDAADAAFTEPQVSAACDVLEAHGVHVASCAAELLKQFRASEAQRLYEAGGLSWPEAQRVAREKLLQSE